MKAESAAGSRSASDARVLTLDDNRIASDVFGQFDQNLALIEQRLGVHLVARGNHVTVSGNEDAADRAVAVLETLEERALSGQAITLGEVDGVLRLSGPTAAPNEREAPARTATAAEIVTRKKIIRARTRNQNSYIKALQSFDMVFALGPAGTGKTYLAVAHAAALLERNVVERIVLSRPAVEAGERLGFLPGDMKDKVDPYLRPLYDALFDVMPADRVERDIASGIIEIAPLAFMRGRTLANAAVILDEAQNTTSMQMKMLLTRLGENGRMIITGDPTQVDLPPGQISGLAEAVNLVRDIDAIARVTFDKGDVVRHPLVAAIVEAYDAADAARRSNRSSD